MHSPTLDEPDLHIYTSQAQLIILPKIPASPSPLHSSPLQSDFNQPTPLPFIDTLPDLPAELHSTAKFYSYLHGLGQPANPECACASVHPAPHQLPRRISQPSSPSQSSPPPQSSHGHQIESARITCDLCQGVIPPLAIQALQITYLHTLISRLQKENHALVSDKEHALVYSDEIRILRLKSENENLRTEYERLREDNERLDTMNERLNGEVKVVNGLFVRVKSDMEAMGEKLLDEIETRAELQHSKEMLQEEVEDLSKSLFEEANTMVSDEKRKLRGVEVVEIELRKELREVREAWMVDLNQLNELRDKLRESTTAERLFIDHDAPQKRAHRSVTRISKPHLQAFTLFLDQIRDTPLPSIITLPYLKHIIELELEPTLNFNLNASSTTQLVNVLSSPTSQSTSARINTKKLLDHITKNTCYVERIASKRDSVGSDTGSMGSLGSIGASSVVSVTRGIFIKSLSERMGLFASSFQNPPPTSAQDTGTLDSYEESQCTLCLLRTRKTHHFKLSQNPNEEYLPICPQCRHKLVSVCEFWGFVRGVKSGVYGDVEVEGVFEKFVGVRGGMFWARAGVETEFEFGAVESGSDEREERDTGVGVYGFVGTSELRRASDDSASSPEMEVIAEYGGEDAHDERDIALSSPVETFGLHHFKM